jgi:SAM-dependent methyltransferase
MTDDMRDFYDDPAELKKWGEDLVAAGLFPCEASLVGEFFTPGAKVLDIGCGGGREAFALAALGFEVTAVDYTPAFVELCAAGARARGLNLKVLQADAAALPFDDAAFDHVMMIGQVLGHVRPHAKRLQVLSEIARVSKSGAVIVSTNAIERSPMYGLYFMVANLWRRVHNPHDLEPNDAFVQRGGGERRPVFHWYHTDEFRLDAARAGWQIDKVLRRWRVERDLADASTSGETFYALRKGTA